MPLLPLVAALTACMLALWLVSLRLRDSSIVDLFWGLGFVLVAWLGVALGEGDLQRRLAGAALTSLWGLRLSGYLAWRNLGHGEDARYRAMREAAGPAWWWRSLVTVFLLQGALILVVSLPVQRWSGAAGPLGALAALGALVALAGVAFESVGDLQLARFKRRPENRGQVLRTGLWRYTRHPNYFGDCLTWWGLWLFAADGGWADALWALPGPLVMTWLLTRVSGVPLLERGMKARPGYEDYVRRTSSFVPWPPRDSA